MDSDSNWLAYGSPVLVARRLRKIHEYSDIFHTKPRPLFLPPITEYDIACTTFLLRAANPPLMNTAHKTGFRRLPPISCNV
jgi:hypothetical protein